MTIAVCVFIFSATLKMEAAGTSVTSVHFYQTIRHHLPVHINFRNDANSINHDCRRRSVTKFSRRSVPAGCFKRTVQLDDWLTVHRSITLGDLQLDAQLTFYRVTTPETAYMQLRRRPPEYEQGNPRIM
jgi:hypothetical protein